MAPGLLPNALLCQMTQPEMSQLEVFPKARETTIQKGRGN